MASEIRMEVDLSGLDAITPRTRRLLGAVVRKTTFDLEAHAKASMSGPKRGRAYKRKGVVHIASAPGEAPAIDTGNLANSIQARMVDDLTGEVDVAADYGPALEFGGKNAARPFMQPAADAVQPGFDKACEVAARKGLEGE